MASGEAGGGSASSESVSRALTRRSEKRAWPARGWFSGSGALGKIGDLLQVLLTVWSVSEKDVAGKLSEKFAEKVADGECFLMMIRLTGKF